MTDIHFQPAYKQAELLASGEIGAEELLDHYLDRVDKYNGDLNAVIWMDVEGAKARARSADKARARGDSLGPLHGVPMTIKESYNLMGSPSTWGNPAWKDHFPERNALSVQRLLDAGANIFGKTNVPFMLADWQSFNDIYGTTNNPWDLTRTPGGSSGGSAAALAAGLSGLEIGSDIGASIRNPAHYCGVSGHKPTYGVIPGHGQKPPGIVADSDIAVLGPLARSAIDLEIALDIMAGAGQPQNAAWHLGFKPSRHRRLSDFRVAVMTSAPGFDVDDEYQACLNSIADKLEQAGATVSRTARPEVDAAHAFETYILLLRAATSGALTEEQLERFRGIVANANQEEKNYLTLMARAGTLSHKDWLRINNDRHHIALKWHAFFKDWDILLCPAAAGPAFPQNQQGERQDRMIDVNDRQQPSTDQMFWAGYSNMVDLPSTVVPAGITKAGLPVGLQAVAAYGEDKTSLALCQLIEEQFLSFTPPPAYK
ncbi:MAG: amidase [Proteobacteria bacterium]|nr:amidase [Pseudomonadota bacterium]